MKKSQLTFKIGQVILTHNGDTFVKAHASDGNTYAASLAEMNFSEEVTLYSIELDGNTHGKGTYII